MCIRDSLLRLYIGETNKDEYEKDEILLIETNIDNLNSQILAYACENLLKQGALDVFTTPIFMKKNRLGICLSVLTAPDRLDKILSTVFSEIPTLGVRIHHLQRRKLSRETISIKTRFGKVKIKISRLRKQVKNLAPEYEDCKKIAQKYGIALKDIYEEVKETSRKVLKVPLFLKSS